MSQHITNDSHAHLQALILFIIRIINKEVFKAERGAGTAENKALHVKEFTNQTK